MLLGLDRVAMAGGGGWKNPYIMDGLCSMWDGEWNVGGGQHDATSNIWKDIVSDAYVEFDNYKHLEDAAYEFREKSVYLHYMNAVAHNALAATTALYNYGNATLEIVAKNNGDNITRNYFFNNFWSTVSYAIYEIRIGGESSHSNEGASPPRVLTADNSSLVFLDSNGTFGYYRNGVKKQSKNYDLTAVTPSDTILLLGREYSTANFTFDGEVSAIRVYNRALTDAEIAANYAIDKARFGLT